jgi:hypothetical protein
MSYLSCMEPLERLRAKISGFPGYDGDLERRRSDEYVRSYLGEALTEFAARSELTPELQQRVNELLLRVGFANPRDFAMHHVIAQRPGADDGGAVALADAATVELADRAASLDSATAPAYLDEVVAVLDGREAAIRAATVANS